MGLFASLVHAAPAIGALGNLASSIGQFYAQDTQTGAQKAWQAYNNTMARMSGAMNQNAITTNEVLATNSLANQGIQLQQKDTLDAAQAEVSAAAAGVAGNSVTQTINSIHAQASELEKQRETSLTGTYLNADQQSRNNSMQVIDRQNNSFIPQPRIGTFLLGAGLHNLQQFPTIFGQYDPKASNATAESNSSTGSGMNQVLSDSYRPGNITMTDLPALRN